MNNFPYILVAHFYVMKILIPLSMLEDRWALTKYSDDIKLISIDFEVLEWS
jgi:hypothetical protein